MNEDTRFCLDWLRRNAPNSPVLRFSFDEQPESGAHAWRRVEIETDPLGDTITHELDETGEHVVLEVLEGIQ